MPRDALISVAFFLCLCRCRLIRHFRRLHIAAAARRDGALFRLGTVATMFFARSLVTSCHGATIAASPLRQRASRAFIAGDRGW